MNDRFPSLRATGGKIWRFMLSVLCFLRRFFFSRKSLVAYVCLATLGALAWYGDLWLARRGWDQEKARIIAAAETLDPLKILPPLPPDEENFFAIPELAPLRLEAVAGSEAEKERLGMWFARSAINITGKDGRRRRGMHLPTLIEPGTALAEVCSILRDAEMLPKVPLDPDPARELLKSAGQWQPLIQALLKGAERRSAVPLPSLHHVSLWDRNSTYSSWMPLLRSLQLYGRAAYESGDKETAMHVSRVFRKITEGFWNDGALIATLIASTLESMQARYSVAGMRDHRWSGEWLAFFAESANEDRVREAFLRSLAMERTGYDALIQKAVKEWPMLISAFGQKPTISLWLQGVYGKLSPEAYTRRLMIRQSRNLSGHLHLDMSFTPGGPTFQQLERQVDAFANSYLPLAHKVLISPRLFKTALALERYYLDHKHYPVTLDDVATTLEPRTLTDLDGQRLRYRTTDDSQQFTLWSVGRDGVDDLAAGKQKDQRDDVVLSTEPQ